MKKLLALLFAVAFALTAPAQVQNMQAGSGTTGDLTKPTLGFNLASGQTLNVKSGATVSGAGSFDFTSSLKLVVPNAAAPTTSAFGWLAAKNNAWASGRGALQFFDGTANTYLVGALASSTPSNGYVPTWQTGGTIIWAAAGAGTIGGSTGATDKAIIRANGTGGATVQNSTATLSDDAILTLPQASLAGTTRGDGVIVSNTTAATVGVQRYSPRVHWTGQGWKTTATAGSQTVDFAADVIPIQGTTSPTAELQFSSQINAGGYANQLVIGSNGSTYFGPSSTAGSISSTSGGLALTTQSTGNAIVTVQSGSVFGVGTPSSVLPSGASGIFGATDLLGSMFIRRASADAFASYLKFSKARNTMASPNVIQSGDIMGGLYWGAFDGSNWTEHGGDLYMETTEQWTGSARGSRMKFSTITTATTTRNLSLILENNGAVLAATPGAGFGYAPSLSVGSSVTQATSKATGATLNNLCGSITMNNAALLPAASVTFVFTNSTITAADVVVVTWRANGATAGSYTVSVGSIAAGSCGITLTNISAGSLSEAVQLNFVVIKSTTS